ncbi:MAG: hypothetical protein LKG27_02345 [Clostridiaceae bacterium]|jgi:hypothetical protein|nr:hypothetical protein [Clostridiaceae bacterium]
MSIEAIGNVIGNKSFAKVAAGTAGTVYVMTAIKALGRPYFIYTDKTTNDKKTKQYAATSEFLYQLLCLGLTIAMVPFFKTAGLKIASKYMKNNKETDAILKEISKNNIFSRANAFRAKYKEVEKGFKDNMPQTEHQKTMAIGNGGIEAGSFVGSIIGLTLIAPPISHKIIAPTLHLLGIHTKSEQTPKETTKVDTKA